MQIWLDDMNKIYKNNFIKSVILKIDFEKISEIDCAKFSFVKENFPTEKNQVKTDYVTTFSKDKQSVERRDSNEYRYYDSAMENCISISENSIFFELKRHIPFSSLKEYFLKILDVLKKEYAVEDFNRVGLRYVNNIVIDNDYEKYFAQELLSNTQYIKKLNNQHNNKFDIALSLGQISLKNDLSMINFIFGRQNRHYPAVMVDTEFLLDIDSYVINVDKDDMVGTIDLLHANIVDLFESSITDELRGLMNNE